MRTYMDLCLDPADSPTVIDGNTKTLLFPDAARRVSVQFDGLADLRRWLVDALTQVDTLMDDHEAVDQAHALADLEDQRMAEVES